MLRQERVEFGEKVFVAVSGLALASELLLASVLVVQWFTWPGLLLGVLCAYLIMFFAGRLYQGDPKIRTQALGWYGLQLLVFSAGWVAMTALNRPDLLSPISFYAPWTAAVKVGIYALLCGAIVGAPSVRAFLFDRSVKSGAVLPPPGWEKEADEEPEPPEPPEPGRPLKLPPEQVQALGGLAAWFQTAGVLALIVGAVLILGVGTRLAILEGAACAFLGVYLLASGGPARAFVRAEEPTSGDLMTSLRRLTWLAYAIFAAAALVAVAVGQSLAARF